MSGELKEARRESDPVFASPVPARSEGRSGGRPGARQRQGERRRLEPDLVGSRLGLVPRQGSREREGARRHEAGPGGKLKPLPADLEAGVGFLPGSGDGGIGAQGPVGAHAGGTREASASREGMLACARSEIGPGPRTSSAAKSTGSVPSPFAARPPEPVISNAPMLSRPGDVGCVERGP